MVNETCDDDQFRVSLLDATRNFRSQLITLEREHMMAYHDAVMRSRLAYIRYLDRFIRTMTYNRGVGRGRADPVLTIANRLMRDEMRNVEVDDRIEIRRESRYVSLRDIAALFNNEGSIDNQFFSYLQDESE